jgi:hypothetical protein
MYSTKIILEIQDKIGEYVVIEKDSHDYDGPVDLCCGPSGSEENIANQQAGLGSALTGYLNSSFANQQDVLSNLNSQLNPILAQGPSQAGFSPTETAQLNTQNINSNAAAASNAERSVDSKLAGQGGGQNGVSSGIKNQIDASLASTAAGNTAAGQTQIGLASEAQGNANWKTAAAGLNALGQQYGSSAQTFGGQADTAEANAFGSANQIQTQKNQEQADIAGAVTSLPGMIAPGAGMLSAGISALSPNADTGFLDAIAG